MLTHNWTPGYGTNGGNPVATASANSFPYRSQSADHAQVLMNNPGADDFPEDDLHELHRSLGQQLLHSFHYGTRVKVLLLLVVPLLLVAYFAPQEAMASAGGGAHAAKKASPLQSRRLFPIHGNTGTAMFWLALVLIVPVNTLMIEYLEDLVVRHDSLTLGIIVNLIFEHAAELIFCFFALSHSKRSLCWVKPMLLGAILLNMLGVLGTSILCAPLSDGTSVDLGISAWTAFSAGGLVFSTAVFLLPTVYEVTVVAPDALDQVKRQHRSSKVVLEEQTRNMLFLSRILAMCVLVVYALYLWKVVRSNSNYYVASDNPNAPSSLTYALQYRERLHSTREVDLGSRYSHRFALIGACVCLLALVGLCSILVSTLSSATKSVTTMPMPFTLVILLPVVFEFGGSTASVLMSQVGRPDIAASIAFASIVHLYMFVMPAVVVMGWLALQVPLELSFHPFLVCTTFLSALVVAQVMMANRVRWLEGGTLLALYGLIVCICLIGRWHICTVGY